MAPAAFRAPHHSASYAAMVGGGPHPRPGELSLAHHGVLFLDEMPEFSRRVLEVLREPLESRLVSISRASYKVDLPAEILLVAAMNPCHCGYLGDGTDRCECTPGQIARYRNRVSGPLLDRIDLHVEVPQQSITALRRAHRESSAVVRERVLLARERQLIRAGVLNARLDVQTLKKTVVWETTKPTSWKLPLTGSACQPGRAIEFSKWRVLSPTWKARLELIRLTF